MNYKLWYQERTVDMINGLQHNSRMSASKFYIQEIHNSYDAGRSFNLWQRWGKIMSLRTINTNKMEKCKTSVLWRVTLRPKWKAKTRKPFISTNQTLENPPRTSMSYPERHKSLYTHPCSIPQNMLYLLLGNVFQFIYKLPSMDIPLLITNAYPIPVKYHKLCCTLLLGYLSKKSF